MVIVRVDFLRGAYVAADPANVAATEWPPAPARLFGALVAGAYAIGVDPEPLTALESAPEIRFGFAQAAPGSINYVPAAYIKGGRPNREIRRPQMVGIDAPVFYGWDAGVDSEWLKPVLNAVTYLGRSESSARLSLVDDLPEMPHALVPDPLGDELLRAPEAGWLATLQARYGSPARVIPPYVGYTDPREQVTPSPWGELFALRASPAELPDAVRLGEALRAATMSHAPAQMSPVLHGHDPVPHAAWLTLPNVGHPHADGRVLGLGMLLPRSASEAERTEAVSALAQVARTGRAGHVAVRRPAGHEHVPAALSRPGWARQSSTWATATPIVLERHPRRGQSVESLIADTCERWGYPRPAAVEVSQYSRLRGVPPARSFRPRKGGRWTHATLYWDRPVRGPMLLGRDQYFGLGLCRRFTL
jgi:CRISPR-associated protein Csb2